MRGAPGVSVTDETMEEIGRLLNEDPGGEAFAWLDTRTGELVLTTSLYGLDPDREDGDDDELIEEHEGAARLPVSGRHSLPDWMDAERRQVEAISADKSGRYRRVPLGVEHGAPGILESFARTLTDATLRDEVREAMRGRGAFRRAQTARYSPRGADGAR